MPGCEPQPGKQTAHAVGRPSDIHFTPGIPLGVRGGIEIYF